MWPSDFPQWFSSQLKWLTIHKKCLHKRYKQTLDDSAYQEFSLVRVLTLGIVLQIMLILSKEFFPVIQRSFGRMWRQYMAPTLFLLLFTLREPHLSTIILLLTCLPTSSLQCSPIVIIHWNHRSLCSLLTWECHPYVLFECLMFSMHSLLILIRGVILILSLRPSWSTVVIYWFLLSLDYSTCHYQLESFLTC